MFHPRLLLACLVFLLASCDPGRSARPESVADFVSSHPDRAERLFAALDLEQPGLHEVRDAVAGDNLVAAGEELLAYYRQSTNGSWLRNRLGVHDPGGFDGDVVAMASAALDDEYLLQGVTGTVARLPSGDIDWHDRGPNDDFQWAIFVNRHFVLLALQKAYAKTEKSEYIQYINCFLQDWIVNNYPAAEGATDRDLPANWRPMSSASRLLQVWPQLFYYLQDVDAFSPATRLMMLSSVPEQVEHLMRYHRRKHNHAIKEMSGLGHAAAAWPEFRNAGNWRDYSMAIMGEEIRLQVYPSGVQKELASHYHRTVLEYVAQFAAYWAQAGVELPADFVALVESMVDYLARTMTPDGHVILNNDSDRDYVRSKIAGWADTFDRDDWRYIASFGADGLAPEGPASQFFPWAGVFVSRSDWTAGAHWSYFDIGPWGVSHQHNDKLHVSLSVGDRNLLVDTGRVNYIADDPIRRHILETAAHNTILIDGKGQGPRQLENAQPMTGVATVTDSFDFAYGRYEDGYPGIEGNASHTRALYYVRNTYWIVVDRVRTDRPRDIEVLWHFHPDTTPGIDAGDVVTSDPGVANLRVHPVGANSWTTSIVSGQTEPEVQGWYSPVYNTVLAAPTARFVTEIEDDAVFAWLLTTSQDDVPDVDTSVRSRDDSAIQFTVDAMTYTFDLGESVTLERNGERLFPASR